MSLAALQDDASLPHERLEACLSNLFEAPTKNLESAFSLILSLLNEQSTRIGAHAEALKRSDEARASLQTAVDGLAKEKAELSAAVEALRQEVEVSCH